MQDFWLNLQSGEQLRFRDVSPDGAFRLDRLAALTGGACAPGSAGDVPDVTLNRGREVPEGALMLARWQQDVGLFLLPDQKRFLVLAKGELDPAEVGGKHVLIWQIATLAAGAAGALRGLDILLVHGALLDTPQGAVLLCGQSGMGKSTTSRRWLAAGGRVYADDLLLLEFPGDEVITHPLPTWSRCTVSLEGEYFPFDRALPLTRMIALGRGAEQEEWRVVPDNDFFAVIYSACVFFYAVFGKRLPEPLRGPLLAAVRKRAEELVQKFPPTALFAHLGADLGETFREFR